MMFFEGCRNLKTNLPVRAFRDGGKPETSILKLYPFNFFSAFTFCSGVHFRASLCSKSNATKLMRSKDRANDGFQNLESYLMNLTQTGYYENTHRYNSLVYSFCFVLAIGAGADRVVPIVMANSFAIQDRWIHTRSNLQAH